MRHGVHFEVKHPHERVHLAPLERRLRHLRAGSPLVADVVVSADTRAPHKGAWNVQLFHGLGDKGYTANPLWLQRGRWPRLRTALHMALRRLHVPSRLLAPPADPGRRRSRYDQVNAYGPRFKDLFEDMLRDAEVSTYGHVALNEHAGMHAEPEGPLLWLPTWDNRRFMGGPNQSSLGAFAHEVALVSRHVSVVVKYHPLTLLHDQDARARAELEKEPGVTLVAADRDPYSLLPGVRGVLTDTSSIGFEAYCMGLPLAVARPPGVQHKGLHAELATRAHVVHSGRPDLLGWAEAPTRDRDMAWVRDLLYSPDAARNDAFAAALEERAT